MEISGHHVMITGANRGIGRAVAMMCAENKAHLHLVNRTPDDELLEALKTAGASSVTQYQADLGTRAGVDAFLRAHGALEVDILFNNAGQLTGGLFETQEFDEIETMMQVNVNALIQLSRHYLPGMLTRKTGKIINHSSVAAYMHFPCASTYAASKAAVAAFTDCLHTELKGTGVSTLLLITAGVETRMFKDIPKLYGKNLDVTWLTSIPPKKYAEMIKEAILEDLDVLKPHGLSGLGLRFAQHLPEAFQKIVTKRFTR
ncbi:MAG: SDR family NAD(P)-dependent oxidoreductase [Bdellovibrionaceae bacterium]|nr:SDR family NAD(P)-dependent oxidoreductase [Pseudobdellovibrionaceae bacterium]